jgi:hypothetical protein
VFSVTYELSSYIPQDGILRSHRRENLKAYVAPYEIVNIQMFPTLAKVQADREIIRGLDLVTGNTETVQMSKLPSYGREASSDISIVYIADNATHMLWRHSQLLLLGL